MILHKITLFMMSCGDLVIFCEQKMECYQNWQYMQCAVSVEDSTTTLLKSELLVPTIPA